MKIDEIIKIIRDDIPRREKILKTKMYYCNKNDILNLGVSKNDRTDPLRNADNRISHNFHQLMVDEKAAYLFTYPVLFDLGSKEINKKVNKLLGDEFESVCKDLCIEVSNAANAFIYYCCNENLDFEYYMVPTEDIIVKYADNRKSKISTVYRYYETIENNKNIIIFEVWTDSKMEKYYILGTLNSIESKFYKPVDAIGHKFGEVPFIEFRNNNRFQNDLDKYKNLIDIYDKVSSGYANDLEDIQQVIYILENYGGEDLKEFLGDLKRYKAVKTDSDPTGGSGSVKTLQIEIPVEARTKLLDILKIQIYESGQGLQQDTESFGNASGVALKFFYRKLELKAGLVETEFKKSFNKLIKVILRYLNINSDIKIHQTYTRNMISNDLENAQIAQISVGVIPKKLIIKNHPWVENPEEAYKLMEEEETELSLCNDKASDKDI
ncbi:phage portal protein [Paraclostridium sordellii]|uniref:phage portal protein n=1 Tax=Paraclostridium sordellii TaxID=1505 RepID=UPI0005E4491D|nr:phage portal protein [Paeniclostridium sordellii]MDU6247313.1 phage portal protein [Paeniclostridium sordellii]MRZ79677.1 phage portal protein [Paeniclostridium sordellii]MSB57715.1 phage portal protein [Paeniclostridium sordellii]MVO70949.1 phage portal protein [Paeniclostridium sordellii]CEO27125.1 SPP1 family phage portal protein [[Clostridium] sordellii] [Paeniclostridium sordellii]